MPTVYTLAANEISVSGGKTISGLTGGNGSHLAGETLTLDSNNWQAIGVTDVDANFQDNQPGSQSLTTGISFNGTTYAAGRPLEAEYTVVFEDPSGNLYTLVAFNIREVGEPNAYGSVEGMAFVGGVGGFPPVGVALTYVSHQEGPSVPYADLATPPCFTRGSFIDTPDGLRLIEDLEVGDLVDTLDHGAQPVRWIAHTRLPAATFDSQPDLRPILIKKDAFGAGSPACDTYMSQQHRVLVSGWHAALLYGEDEVLVPAKKLLNDSTIVLADADADVEYIHLVFDEHEILTVDGLLSESFLPSANADVLVPIKAEFLRIFGVDSCSELDIAPARMCVSDRTTDLINQAA